MLTSHVKFHSVNGKRQILIVDDEQVNRELLGYIAASNFDVLYASDGVSALKLMEENAHTLSLVLLDLNMPEMDGFQVMSKMMENEALKNLPVLVMTSEEDAEIDCLKLGAADFIAKPFRAPEVVIARMQRTIELYEDRTTIEATERDDLTGLFTRDYFFNYTAQYDMYHPDAKMDAISVNINNFHLINELYGREAGDNVLHHMGMYLLDLRDKTGATIARIEADQFLIYISSGVVNYEEISEDIDKHFDTFPDIHVRVRSGIYRDVDKSIEMERRFDRAMQAANTIKDDYKVNIAYYDESIHQKRLFDMQLIDEFDEALEQGQFQLYFQPKYNIEGETPFLTSAETLIRWAHPVRGMISPGVFIPLFESNGLITKLDFWIWKKAIQCIADWKKKYNKDITLSINISRVDLYNHNLVSYLEDNLEEYGVSKDQVYLEITESAYSEETNQLVNVVDKLRGDGFKIEMDDFGTGYSSLGSAGCPRMNCRPG